MKTIYMDNAASTKMDEKAADVMTDFMRKNYDRCFKPILS